MTSSHEDVLAVFDEKPADHRRRTRRQERHHAHLIATTRDGDHIDELPMARSAHDVGRKTSAAPRRAPAPGRRGGFKVWKTPFWKRRTSLYRAQNQALRRLADET